MKKKFMLNVCENLLKVVFLFFVFFWAITPVVQAADIDVTTTGDNVPGSLRAAIATANSNGEDDTIHLPAGTYMLSGEAGDDANTGGDLDINSSHKITIIGAGAETTIIDGNQLDRLLHILEGTVSISGVTFQNGKTRDGQNQGEDGENGGGIYNCGDLTLTNCSIENNTCGMGKWGGVGQYGTTCPGGGGYGGGIYNTGSLTMTGCTIKNNAAGDCGGAIDLCTVPNGGHGGGIYNSSTAAQVLKNCTISNNTSGNGYEGGWDHDVPSPGGDGGGIYNEGIQTLTSCTIKSNTTGYAWWDDYSGSDNGRSGHGGGIYNSGVSNIKKTIIKFNATGNKEEPYLSDRGGNGGGIYNSGTLNLTQCTINLNSTGESGDGGGIFHLQGTLTLSKCILYNNNTGRGIYTENGGSGGGIFNSDTATLTNCTISTNHTAAGGSGGGIYNNSTISLIHATICDNYISSEEKSSNENEVSGGGIYNTQGTVTIKNTIIANNQAMGESKGPDCSGTLNSQGYNLVESTDNCTITGDITGNIIGQPPLLGPLADNGGLTDTHALLAGSPAIDAGDSAGISTDQRDYTRPVDIPGIPNVGDGADIGAYESASTSIMYAVSGKITYNGTGLPGVILTFSNSGTCTTDEEGNYSHTVPQNWSGTVTPSIQGYVFTPSSRTYTNIASAQTNQDYTAAPAIPPQITLNRSQLNFGLEPDWISKGEETFVITNSGGGILRWSLSWEADWLSCSPTTGTGTGTVTVTVDAAGLSPGTYTAVITIKDDFASNSPQVVNVILNTYDLNQSDPPFGVMDTPIDGSTVSGSIPVSGWALDDMAVYNIYIFRDPVAGEGDQLVFIGTATRVEGARPDIEATYPDYPFNYKAGWGYMLLTNLLPNQGNGTFTIYAEAVDKSQRVILEKKTIICDNANAVEPFGTIDSPGQGALASGSEYINFAWALTPLPNRIPTDGSTITVWVDGVPVGNPVYNRSREDIAALFPGYNNSEGAGGHFYLDTTAFENGVHTISWSVTDDAGNTEGIGSRYFRIENAAGSAGSQSRDNTIELPGEITTIPIDYSSPIRIIKGYKQNIEPQEIHPDENGMINIEINQLQRLEIHLAPSTSNISPLPPGSTFDPSSGIFSWQPGPASLGDFQLAFIKKSKSTEMRRIFIKIKIKANGK